MRAWLPLLAAALVALSAAPPAAGAPTCWNAAAETVRCGTPGALPVGARLTPAQAALRRSRDAAGGPAPPLIGLMLLLAGLFGLIALLPDFDGWDRR